MNDELDSCRSTSPSRIAHSVAMFCIFASCLHATEAPTQPLDAPTADQPARESAGTEKRPPLVVLDISERWIAALAERLFDERSRVDVRILGVRMQGTARTQGGYTVRCVDGDGGLCFAVAAKGTSVSSTRGREGPALIRATTITDFTASKTIELNGQSLVAGPTSVEATMRRRDTRVDTRFCLGRALVRRVANRRIREGRAEIERKSEQRTEQRLVLAVDRAVERFRQDTNRRLRDMQTRMPWIGWGDEMTPVHLQTDDRVLRLTWRDGGGEMVDPFYLAVGEPNPGLRLWVDRRAFRVESAAARWEWSDRLRQRLSRAWLAMALLAPLLPDESSDAPWSASARPAWSAELVVSSWALRVTVPSAGVIVRVPGPRDPITATLTAAAQSLARSSALGRPSASEGQDDAIATPKRRQSRPTNRPKRQP